MKRRAQRKLGRQCKPCKRKASNAEPVGGVKASPNKKCKKTAAKVGVTKVKSKKPAAKDGVTKVKKLTVKSSFTLSDVLTAWTDTSDFGASFRAFDESDQKKLTEKNKSLLVVMYTKDGASGKTKIYCGR